jgi:hypothetical protein
MADNRGGSRTGAPGRAYTNRSDLNENRVAALPISTPTYGEGAAQRRSLQAVPTGIPKLPPLNRPTDFPDEPLTAGMARGPGPGPESLAPLQAAGPTMSQQELERMRGLIPALEVIASLQDTSPTFRAFVRDLRGRVRST